MIIQRKRNDSTFRRFNVSLKIFIPNESQEITAVPVDNDFCVPSFKRSSRSSKLVFYAVER